MSSKNPSPGHKIPAEISIHLDRGTSVTLFVTSDALPGGKLSPVRIREPKAVALLTALWHELDGE